MSIRSISTEQAPRAVGPYSQAVVAGGFIFVSGQVGIEPATGRLVGDTTVAQARQAIENVRAILAAAGSGLGRVVKTTVYLVDIAEFKAVNEVYADYFSDELRPARATVQVAALPLGARVEIEAIARE